MKFQVSTKGHGDTIDITARVGQAIRESGLNDGIALIFAAHSTVAITTIEYEEGVVSDLKRVLEEIAPEEADYEHHKKWGDHNGAAHVKSAILGTDFLLPVENGQPMLGTWQQIVLIDFDEKAREREVIVKVIAGVRNN
jgi:secondary thiamine-phosphate synthase enzyme